MPKIRKDLDGTVTAYRQGKPITLAAGDDVPDGVSVGAHVLEGGRRPAAAAGTVEAFDPGAHNVQDVNSYLDEHPDEVAAVLKAEKAGKARTGIVGGRHSRPRAAAQS